jgi:transposase
MFGISVLAAIYLSTRATDMRKSIDGLCGELQEYIGRNPVDGSLFVFYNRRRDKLKMLWWDRDGYWVLYKRLEAGTFEVPAHQEGSTQYAPRYHTLTGGIPSECGKRKCRFFRVIERIIVSVASIMISPDKTHISSGAIDSLCY